MKLLRYLSFSVVGAVMTTLSATAQPVAKDSAPLFPVSPVIVDRQADEVYPSVSGDFLVYSQRKDREFSVRQTSVSSPKREIRTVSPRLPKEAVRFGVALHDGAIGYVSNRMGPISAWMRLAQGNAHMALANTGSFSGAIVPLNLHASRDGRVWCFDATLQKTQRSRLLNDFGDGTMHADLLGQTWRTYDSNWFVHRMGYRPSQTGTVNKFEPPYLFVLNRDAHQMVMIPDAYDGAVSPDGRRIAFVRSINGNYDLWMQDLDGGRLTQLTSSEFGEFEPAWSPDGKKIAFVSNRDSEGDIDITSIYVLDLASGHVTRVTNATSATDGGVTWKNADTILFHSNRSPDKPQSRTVSDWNIWQVKNQGGF
ncbi:MAG TPA: hypothetical protein VJ961_06565 [Mariprofundaceae bacterium]|nr:hypothetical protein [Mariprofundaceae bacterium]